MNVRHKLDDEVAMPILLFVALFVIVPGGVCCRVFCQLARMVVEYKEFDTCFDSAVANSEMKQIFGK